MGATLLLPNTSIVQLEFWKFMDNNNVTSLATVPHGYEYIRKMKLLETKFSFKYFIFQSSFFSTSSHRFNFHFNRFI